jgi:hypothetical protein
VIASPAQHADETVENHSLGKGPRKSFRTA